MSNTMNGIYWKGMVKCGFSDTGMLNRCSQLGVATWIWLKCLSTKDLNKVFKYKAIVR